MDELIERLRNLPKEPLTFQGAILTWPGSVRSEGGGPIQPLFPLWVESESGLMHPGMPLSPDEDTLPASLETLVGFVEEHMGSRACPERLEVRDPQLADYLRYHLHGTGIDVQLSDQLPALEAAFREMAEFIASRVGTVPSLLDARGVSIERVGAFADAAAAFYRAAPWRHLSDSDLIQIESPKPPRGMACCIVLGAGRTTYGLGFYPSRAAYDRFVRAGHEGDYDSTITTGLAQVFFDALEELPLADAALWSEHGLPVAGQGAYPVAMKLRGQGEFSRPTKTELTFLEGILRALAATSEEEIDSGRWHKETANFDGVQTMTLAIPDLLQPPPPQEWMRRGFMPDRRAHERLFADMHRFLQENPPTGEDGLEEVNRLFAGRSLDEPLTEPRSPAERAQDLCFQAFDTHGRRRVQLARQALQLDPNCADAHVILAEQAGTLEDELDHYRRGVEAAERTLGADFFVENAGHFWGISETRPYMRARFGLAESLAAAGRSDEAIAHLQELLRLNPGDNQGVRYVLLPRLLAAGRDEEAARLLRESDEESACWAYARTLLAFRLSRRSATAERELRNALRNNPHVPELLCSDGPIPLPPHYAPGSLEEACVAAVELRPAFQATAGALDWLADAQERRASDLDRRRREKRRQERAKRRKRKRP